MVVSDSPTTKWTVLRFTIVLFYGGGMSTANNEQSTVYALPQPVGVAMVTPFHPDGSLDGDSARKTAVHLVEQGVNHLVLSGTTGESPTTHAPEKEKLIQLVREEVGDTVFITSGASSNDTQHAVRMAQGAKEAGADGLLVVTPYYNRPSQEGVYRHIEAITQAVDLPITLYDIPGRTGVAIADETLDRLSQIPNVVAVKDATGDVEQGANRIANTGLAFYSGDDGLNYAWLTHGAIGIISVVAHVAGKQYSQLIRLVQENKYQDALELSLHLQPLVKAIMGGGQGAVMAKYALYLQGVIASPNLRLPLVGPAKAEIAHLEATLQGFGLL